MEQQAIRTIVEIGEISADGVLVCDLDSLTIEYCNQALADITNIPFNRLHDKHIDILRTAVSCDPLFLERQLRNLRTKGKLLNLEMKLALRTGFVAIDVYVLHEPNCIVAFVKDISKSKQHLDYIVEFGARKNVLLDMVAHNLSGPLNVTNNLLDRVDQVAEAGKFKQLSIPVRLIRENTQQCIDMIHSLLVEEHTMSPDISVAANRFEVITRINSIIERFRQFTPGKRFSVQSAVGELYVWGDDVKFFQVVNNLVSNAVKFTNSDSQIDVIVNETALNFSVSVRDNGIGIPDYLRPHIFEPKTRAGRNGLKGEKSTGMGLHIVKKLVTLMCGSISFESHENEGSVFTIELPKDLQASRSVKERA